MLNEFKAQGASKVKELATVHDPIDYLKSRGFTAMPMQFMYTPLDVQCLDCGGQYTIWRGRVSPVQAPPVYCVWCASKHITIVAENTDEAAYTTLAMHYALPLNVIKFLYSQYASQSRTIKFSDYMDMPERLEIRAKLAGLAS